MQRRNSILKACSGVLTICVLVAASSHSCDAVTIVDPDRFASGADLTAAFPGVSLSLFDGPGDSGRPPVGTKIYARATTIPIPGNNTFAFRTNDGDLRPIFVRNLEELRADFAATVGYVAVDFITDDNTDPARLEAFDALGNLLGFFETPGTAPFGGVETAEIMRPQNDIAFITAGGIRSQGVYVDNLRYSVVPEPGGIAIAVVALVVVILCCRL